MYAERAQLFLIKLKGSYPVDTTINKIKEYIAVRNVDMGQLENETARNFGASALITHR